ncbi:FlaA1/EpsC-like NDP-sugar epimerase [Marmoricola bigeumensis]|uniref:FlaA1/EpsC-like NDP-sugar epimerase n=2 Tax=Nocardioides marmoribigeumensis TaxID=433649 RepID=A0ABU2BTQ2_9ACTN|nr:FlaA1/EpsC-like NDP-sugar epimerase [Nocardioides marmoribigeumensis]
MAPWGMLVFFAVVATCGHLALGSTFKLQQGRYQIGALEELMVLSLVATTVGGALTVANLIGHRLVPGTVPPVATILALLMMCWVRGFYRSAADLDFRPARGAVDAGARRVIVFGAGNAGRQLITSMLRDPAAAWRPVALLDDDQSLRHRRIRGVRVLGGREALADTARRHEADALVIAIPSARADLVRELQDLGLEAGVAVKVLPATAELMNAGRVEISDIRDIEVTDLLGRHQIDTDIEAVAGYLTGKRVLVTGAGGSIGSELCRQIAKFGPDELIMLDRDESALHAVQLSIYGKAMLDSDDVVLADIRDSLFIDTLFEQRKPHVVFHAAALKHLPMLEQYPGEAIKTNVWGTLSILEAAKAHGVERFVNISTDKAANPCSVLGYSKRLAEGLTAAIAPQADGTYLSVRFGNVLGSRGSVLTAFAAQIANGGPVTVTDPSVTRYFMTVQEAVQLVIQAAAIGRDGEALVLDMGEPVSIDGVARQLIDLSGKDVEVVYTGLREGEKMHEELWGDGEPDLRPAHPLVSHTPVPAFAPTIARELDPWASKREVIAEFRKHATSLSVRIPGQRAASPASQSVGAGA